MLTVDASEAKADLCELIDQVLLSHESILITGRKSNAVLLAEDEQTIWVPSNLPSTVNLERSQNL